MTELRTCAHCGTAEGELTEFNGRLYCEDCLDDLTLVCTDCGSRFLRTHNRSENDDFPICPECYDRDYTRCVRCGRIIDTDHCWYPLDNDDPYCADCCSTIENSPIHDYYFKPYPIFYGDGPRYFGVELEIDDGGECDSSAEALMNITNSIHAPREGATGQRPHLRSGLGISIHAPREGGATNTNGTERR